MIKTFTIRNFKSIKHLELDCKRINIFIGKPNTGKSNILESLGIFSSPYVGSLKSLLRFEIMNDLFYDRDLDGIIAITADQCFCEIRFKDGEFLGKGRYVTESSCYLDFNFSLNYDGLGSWSFSGSPPFKFYRFRVINEFIEKRSDFLLPPQGLNLLMILLTNKSLKKFVKDIFSEFGLKIALRPEENKIEVLKEIEDVIISYPYSLISDTLQRLVFHLTAMETNKDSIIIFEEPEAHSFPYYTKFLGERIALDKTNQYFISTHNPYFLLSVLEKTSKDEMGIFITYLKDFQTRVRQLSEDEKEEILNLDASLFFNLERFVEEA